jgi:VanZ family protein
VAETRAAPAAHLWLAAGWALAVLVVWGSLTPSPPDIEPPFMHVDKLEHFSAYLILTAWFTAAAPRRWLWIGLAFAAAGGLIEIAQAYTGRDAEWLDWAADCAGAAVGLWYPARWLARLRLSLIDAHVHRA